MSQDKMQFAHVPGLPDCQPSRAATVTLIQSGQSRGGLVRAHTELALTSPLIGTACFSLKHEVPGRARGNVAYSRMQNEPGESTSVFT